MNTIKTGKLLALVVVLAMVLSIMPGFAASAAVGVGEETFSISFNLVDPADYTTGYTDIQVLDTNGKVITGFCYAPDGFYPFHREATSNAGDITANGGFGAGNDPKTGFGFNADTRVTIEWKQDGPTDTVTYTVENGINARNDAETPGTVITDYISSRTYTNERGISGIVAPNVWRIAANGNSPITRDNFMTNYIKNVTATVGGEEVEVKPAGKAKITVKNVDAESSAPVADDFSIEGYYADQRFTYNPGSLVKDGKIYSLAGESTAYTNVLLQDENTFTVQYADSGKTVKTVEVPKEYKDVENSKLYAITGKNLVDNPSFETADGSEFTAAGWFGGDKNGLGVADAKSFYAVKADGYTYVDGTEETAATNIGGIPDGSYALGGRYNHSETGLGSVLKNIYVGNNKTVYVSFWVKATTADDALMAILPVKGDAAAAGTGENCIYVATGEDNANRDKELTTYVRADDWYQVQKIVTTDADTDTVQINLFWLGDNSNKNPYFLFDDFVVAEATEGVLEGAITYDIVYTTDGTANGKVIATDKENKGEVGNTVNVEAGKYKNVRVGNEYYTTNAAELNLVGTSTTYYVGATKTGTITGFAEPIVSVGDYAPVMPAKVKAVMSEDSTAPAEEFEVTWEGTTGTVKLDEATTMTVNAVKAEKSYGLVDNDNVRVQNNQIRAKNHALMLPQAVTGKMAIEYQIKFARTEGDLHVALVDVDKTSFNNDLFKSMNVHTLCNGSFKVRNGDHIGGGSNVDLMPIEVGKTYTVLITVDVANHTFDYVVVDEEGKSASAYGNNFRTDSDEIDAVLAIANNPPHGDGAFTMSNIQVYAEGATAPEASALTANLDYIKDGDKADTLTLNFTANGAYAGKVLKIEANDSAVVDDNQSSEVTTVVSETLVEGKPIVALIPRNPNVTYTATLVDAETGYAYARAKANMYELVAADIKANDYANSDVARVDQAVQVLSKGGVVFGDAIEEVRDFISVDTATEGTIKISISDELYAKGFGFKGAVKAGKSGAVKDTAPAEADKLYQTITITGNTVTVESADGVEVFSLDSVNIEFVATEAGETEAAAADSAVDADEVL